MTNAELAKEAIDILVENGIISKDLGGHMSEKSFDKYTQPYFLENIKVMAAMCDVPEATWKIVEIKLGDEHFAPLFKRR